MKATHLVFSFPPVSLFVSISKSLPVLCETPRRAFMDFMEDILRAVFVTLHSGSSACLPCCFPFSRFHLNPFLFVLLGGVASRSLAVYLTDVILTSLITDSTPPVGSSSALYQITGFGRLLLLQSSPQFCSRNVFPSGNALSRRPKDCYVYFMFYLGTFSLMEGLPVSHMK